MLSTIATWNNEEGDRHKDKDKEHKEEENKNKKKKHKHKHKQEEKEKVALALVEMSTEKVCGRQNPSEAAMTTFFRLTENGRCHNNSHTDAPCPQGSD